MRQLLRFPWLQAQCCRFAVLVHLTSSTSHITRDVRLPLALGLIGFFPWVAENGRRCAERGQTWVAQNG